MNHSDCFLPRSPSAIRPPASSISIYELHSPPDSPTTHRRGREGSAMAASEDHAEEYTPPTADCRLPTAQPGASATMPIHQMRQTTTSTKPPQPSCLALSWSAAPMALALSTIIRPPLSSAWCATSTALATISGSISVTAPAAWTSAWRVRGGWCGYWGGISMTIGEGWGWLTDVVADNECVVGRWRSTCC